MRRILNSLMRADLKLFRRISGSRSSRIALGASRRRSAGERVLPLLSRSANMSALWIAIAALLAALAGRSGKRAAMRGLGSIGVTSAIVNALVKPVFRRRRPSLRRVPALRRLARQPVSTSFPSGHAASAAAFATGVGLERPKTGAAVGALAGAVAYSRVYTGVHYPADVVAGSALGAGVALASRRAWPALPPAGTPALATSARRRLPPNRDGTGVTVVVNPGSGPALGAGSVESLRSALPAARVAELGEDDDPEAVLARAAKESAVIGAWGGDGTIAAAADAALAAGRPLLVLPGGTMNHLARDLGLDEADDALVALARGEAVEIDVGEVGGKVFLNNVSLGAYSRMVDIRRSLEPRIGRWPAQAVALLRAMCGDPVSLEIDGRRRSVWMLFVGNGAYHARGIAPGWRERLTGGSLDVRLIDATRRAARLRAVTALVANRLERSPVFERRETAELSIGSGEPVLQIGRDGELLELDGPLTIRVRPRGLTVYAPGA